MNLPPIYVGARAYWLAGLVGCGVLQAGSAVVAGIVLQRHLDQALAAADSGHVSTFMVIMVTAALIAGAARWSERYLAERLAQDYVSDLRVLMFRTLARRSAQAGRAASRGAVQLRFITDLSALSAWISLGQARLVVAAPLLIGSLGYMVSLSPAMAGLVASTLAASAVASVLLGQGLEKAVIESRRRRGNLASLTTEKLASLPTILGFGRLQGATEQLRHSSARLRDAMTVRALWTGSLRAVNEISIRLAIGGVVAFGLVRLHSGDLTAGALLAAVSLVAFLVAPVRDMGGIYERWKSAKVARRKVAEWVDIDREVKTARNRHIHELRGELEIADLAVGPDCKQPLSIVVARGERVLVCGANGAGKTSLLWILAGVQRSAAGRVQVDGQPVHRLARSSLNASIGIASPELPLVKGSIRRNLRYRVPEADDAELSAICRTVGLDRVAPLPGLLDVSIEEGGSNLSKGQKARLQLGRALAATPNILLLDELDADLDEEGRDMLRTLIADYPGTVIFVSHDPVVRGRASQCWMISRDGIRVGDADPLRELPTDRSGSLGP